MPRISAAFIRKNFLRQFQRYPALKREAVIESMQVLHEAQLENETAGSGLLLQLEESTEVSDGPLSVQIVE